MSRRPKFDIFPKALFEILAPITNLVPKTVPIVSGQYLWNGFTFSTKNWFLLEFQKIFKKVKAKRKLSDNI